MPCLFSEFVVAVVPLADLLTQLEQSGGLVAYGAMVLVLVLGAVGLPVPEEVVLATAGAMAAQGRMSLALAFLVGWSTILLLDIGLHTVGRWAGPHLRRSRLGRRIPEARWRSIRRFVALRGAWAVAAARFVMGFRIPTFLLAGATGMTRRRFVPVVAVAGLASTGVPLALGYALGPHLDAVVDALLAARWVLLAAALIALLLLWRHARGRVGQNDTHDA